MKKVSCKEMIIKVLVFIYLVIIGEPSFSLSLQETAASIKHLRQKYATSNQDEPYKGKPQTVEYLKDLIGFSYNVLEGRTTQISGKSASPEERIQVLGLLFQNQIVEKRLGKALSKEKFLENTFHEVNLSHAHSHLIGHFSALWVMLRGVRALICNPHLGLNPQSLLTYFQSLSEPIHSDIQKLFTLSAIKTLFPEGFFLHVITYAYRFPDYTHQAELKKIMEPLNIKLSAEKGFNMTPKRECYVRFVDVDGDGFLTEVSIDEKGEKRPNYLMKNTILKEQVNKYLNKNIELSNQVFSLTANQNFLKQECSSLKLQREALQREAEAAKKEKSSLEIQLESLKLCMQTINGTLKSHEDLQTEKKEEKENLLKEIQELIKQKENLTQTLATLEKDKENLQDTLRNLEVSKAQLETLMEDHRILHTSHKEQQESLPVKEEEEGEPMPGSNLEAIIEHSAEVSPHDVPVEENLSEEVEHASPLSQAPLSSVEEAENPSAPSPYSSLAVTPKRTLSVWDIVGWLVSTFKGPRFSSSRFSSKS